MDKINSKICPRCNSQDFTNLIGLKDAIDKLEKKYKRSCRCSVAKQRKKRNDGYSCPYVKPVKSSQLSLPVIRQNLRRSITRSRRSVPRSRRSVPRSSRSAPRSGKSVSRGRRSVSRSRRYVSKGRRSVTRGRRSVSGSLSVQKGNSYTNNGMCSCPECICCRKVTLEGRCSKCQTHSSTSNYSFEVNNKVCYDGPSNTASNSRNVSIIVPAKLLFTKSKTNFGKGKRRPKVAFDEKRIRIREPSKSATSQSRPKTPRPETSRSKDSLCGIVKKAKNLRRGTSRLSRKRSFPDKQVLFESSPAKRPKREKSCFKKISRTSRHRSPSGINLKRIWGKSKLVEKRVSTGSSGSRITNNLKGKAYKRLGLKSCCMGRQHLQLSNTPEKYRPKLKHGPGFRIKCKFCSKLYVHKSSLALHEHQHKKAAQKLSIRRKRRLA